MVRLSQRHLRVWKRTPPCARLCVYLSRSALSGKVAVNKRLPFHGPDPNFIVIIPKYIPVDRSDVRSFWPLLAKPHPSLGFIQSLLCKRTRFRELVNRGTAGYFFCALQRQSRRGRVSVLTLHCDFGARNCMRIAGTTGHWVQSR